MKRWPLGFLLVLAVSVHAESFWDGNAAVQRGDAAFEAGMVALSSAFARDTEIVVEDPATGRTTTVRVIGRIEDRLDLLVLLSPAAALPLGLESGVIVRVRVTLKRAAPSGEPILAEKIEGKPDVDRVPPAVQREATIVETAEAPAAEEPAAQEPAAQPEVAEAPAPAATAPVTPAAAEKQPTPTADEAALLAELSARSPQKRLFLPPREDEMFAYQKPVQPPAEAAPPVEVVKKPETTAPATAEAAAGIPEIAAGVPPAAPNPPPEPIAVAEARPPEEIRPEVVDSRAAETPEPGERPLQPLAEPPAQPPAAMVATAPAAATTPAAAPVARPAEVAPPPAAVKPEPVQTVLDLPGQGSFTWYLQLAAYASESMARDMAARLSPTYPVLVLAPQPGAKALYRVFVGPLNRAESGTLLVYFRDRGFPDAFVRTARK